MIKIVSAFLIFSQSKGNKLSRGKIQDKCIVIQPKRAYGNPKSHTGQVEFVNIACIQRMSLKCAAIQLYSYYDNKNEHDNFSVPPWIQETGSRMSEVGCVGLKNKKPSHI